jgi:hypothetical protein
MADAQRARRPKPMNTCIIGRDYHSDLCITYVGTPAQFVESGAATIEETQRWQRKSRGHQRVDEDGDLLIVEARYKNGRVRLRRYKTPARALELGMPGVAEWLRDHPRVGREYPAPVAPVAPLAKERPPWLRLVVDNTLRP